MVDAVTWELFRASGGENEVALDACVDDLDDDLLVGETDNQAVLGSVATKLFISTLLVEFTGNTYYLFFAWVISLLRA